MISSNRLIGVATILVLLGAGCASSPRPKVLQDASHVLNRSEASELEALRPKLLEQAREYLRKAEDAYERGDLEATRLYAHMAIQRFETASNHVARDSAQALAEVMDKSRQEAAERQDELQRYRSLEERIAALDADLERAVDKGSEEVRAAKSALIEARRKQAEAIGAGAPTHAPQKYKEGRSLVETSVESLELAMYSEATKTSARAVTKLDEAIEEARSKKAAMGSAEGQSQEQGGGSERLKAQSAVNDAATAQASAIAQRAPQKNPELFNQGASLLQSAERRLRDGDFRGARLHAEDAIGAFRQATTEQSADKNSAVAAIRAAEDARSGAIGRGATSDQLTGGDFLLDTARRALESGDSDRAKDKAKEARAAFAGAGGSGVVARRASAGSDSVSELAEAKIIELRFQRAELIGQSIDQTCGPPYREFEAILQLAGDRLAAGDGARAYEFAIRAQERLRACDPSKPAQGAAVKGGGADAEIARSKAAAQIRKAQQELAAARASNREDPRLQQPASLIDNAERWYTRKAYDDAHALAKEASAILARIRSAPAPAAKRVGGAADEGDAAKAKAAKAIQQAQESHAKASAQRPDAPSVQQAGLLLSAAERWFEQGAYDRAEALALKAEAELRKPGGTPSKKDESTTAAETGPACRDARGQLEDARSKDFAVQTGKLTPQQTQRRRDARALLRTANEKLETGACTEAGALAYRAQSMLSDLPGNEESKTPAADETPSGTTETPTKPETGPTTSDKPQARPAWKTAYDEILHALRLRDQARTSLSPEARSSYEQGDRALGEARKHYRAKRYPQAEAQAASATSFFETALQSSGETPLEASPPTPAPKRSDPEVMVEQTIQRHEAAGTTPSDPTWKAAYRDVVAALSARDLARGVATPADEEALARGKSQLAAARDAWSKKRYSAASTAANEARGEFASVVAAVSARAEAQAASAQPEPKDVRDKAKFREADQAIREAKVTLLVCERERCDDRDFSGLAEAREMVDSAQASFASGDYSYATQLATDAKDKLRDVLAKPRKTKPEASTEDPAKDAELRRKAEEAVREAVIARKLCERSGCARVDYEAWLRADQLMSTSQAAYADDRFDDAAKDAEKAEELLRKTLEEAPNFSIPEGISGVSLVDNQLVVAPPITFYTGAAAIKPESQPSVQKLADVIKQNEASVERVDLVGFTDSRGDRAKNTRLSAARAQTVLRTLVGLGVPRAKLVAEGRGPINPVADNSTAEGRARNRRVEVHVTLAK